MRENRSLIEKTEPSSKIKRPSAHEYPAGHSLDYAEYVQMVFDRVCSSNTKSDSTRVATLLLAAATGSSQLRKPDQR